MKLNRLTPLFALFLIGCSGFNSNSSDVHTHSLVHHNPQEATCTEGGFVEYWSCSNCWKRYLDHDCTIETNNVTIPALGHNYVLKNTVAASATSSGILEHYECDRCHELFVLENNQYVSKELEELTIPIISYFDVSFDYPGISFQHILCGETANEPIIIPSKSSTDEYTYSFVEWQLNGEKFDFNTPITKDILLTPYFRAVAREYSITFIQDGKENIVKTFTCETDPSTFIEPDIEEVFGYIGLWSSYDLTLLKNQTSTAYYVEAPNLLDKPVIEKHQGYTIKFHVVDNATKYIVHDDNDFREKIELNASDADADGYLYYTTEVVGKHNVSITATADNFISRTSDIFRCVENEPVFAYSPFHSVYFYDIRSNPQANTYSLQMEDGSWQYVTQEVFNSTYIYNKGNLIDYTEAKYIDNIMLSLKESGSNIVSLSNRFVDVENYNTWWWGTSFETSALKRAMDSAYRHNMKCIITDFTILNSSTKADKEEIIKSRLTSKEFKDAIKHPAFYGIELEDEPMPGEEIVNIGKSVKALLSAWRNDSELSKMKEPFIHTDLCSYNRNKNSESTVDPYLFDTPQDYQDYLESWLINTGLNYLCFDYYTYTTYIYGQQSYLGKQYYYDSSKVIFDAVNALRNKYSGLTVHQTITASNYNKRLDVSSKDVFASTYLSISQGFYGYSIFTFSPSSATSENQPVDYNFNKTNTYTWIKEANEHFKFIKGLLDGYKFVSNEMSTYKQKIGLTDEGIGYGFGVRTSTSIFSNDKSEIKMVVNYNSYTTNTSVSVDVPINSNYIVFGYQKPIQVNLSNGSKVSLNNGEAILILQ